ncbi:AAA family ATPase [Iocasia frigidifontis]|uniref:Replication-associated recombination protein A n=1 Tax=Iocasia fonsfrigidae TaxID=2682810 RepID=A0A8A7K8E6_9FIRM|nr:replication-associated recombination protein A [Iocasia fonsfrigidae]QTL98016.1 AAA family ATPase [Iocasia fonsfrigidae]
MIINLFEQKQSEEMADKPLAFRMRPRTLDEVYGQEEIIGEGKLLNRAIKADRLQSLIFYGPPGTGKTSLAYVIANHTEADFIRLNAVTSGVKQLREVIKRAANNLSLHNQKTILFIDEIHRFNKSQQDALLPAVEKGTIIMVGATTENPYFEVNSPLLSRSRIFSLKPLQDKEIISILKRALSDKERGLGDYEIGIGKKELEYIADLAAGDARTALNALELAVLTTPLDEDGLITINKEVIAESLQKKVLNYDKNGDNHYDNISAFIKSIRGSDPDAALFWLAKMIVAGEDPRFIARRVIVHAAEDIGLADPAALEIAVAAAQAVEHVGFPEARIPLAEAVLYLATAPKSNSVVRAIDTAVNYVQNNPTGSVPLHLRDVHYQGAETLGHGKQYKYPHDYPDNYVKQQYLPDGLDGLEFYQPGTEGKEIAIKERMIKLYKRNVGRTDE